MSIYELTLHSGVAGLPQGRDQNYKSNKPTDPCHSERSEESLSLPTCQGIRICIIASIPNGYDPVVILRCGSE